MNSELLQKHKRYLAKEKNPDNMTPEEQYQEGLRHLRHYEENMRPSLFPNDNAILVQSFSNNTPLWQPAYWFELAASKGHVKAAYNLGLIYEEGIGVTPNKETAKYWYAKAEAGGHLGAQHNLELLNKPSLWNSFLRLVGAQPVQDNAAAQQPTAIIPSIN